MMDVFLALLILNVAGIFNYKTKGLTWKQQTSLNVIDLRVNNDVITNDVTFPTAYKLQYNGSCQVISMLPKWIKVDWKSKRVWIYQNWKKNLKANVKQSVFLRCFDDVTNTSSIKHLVFIFKQSPSHYRIRKNINIFNLFKLAAERQPELSNNDCTENSPPVAMATSHTIAVKSNKFEQKMISNLFTDREDGENLKMALVWANEESLQSNDWLQFLPRMGFLYIWMTYDIVAKQPNDGYKFKLTSTDECNSSTSISFYVKAKPDTTQIPCVIYYVILKSLIPKQTPFVHIIPNVANIISTFLREIRNVEKTIIKSFQYIDMESNLIKLEFFESTSICGSCFQLSTNEKTTRGMLQKLSTKFGTNFLLQNIAIDVSSCDHGKVIPLYNEFRINISRYNNAKFNLPKFLFYDTRSGKIDLFELEHVNCNNVFAYADGNILFIYKFSNKIKTFGIECKQPTYYLNLKRKGDLKARIPIILKKNNEDVVGSRYQFEMIFKVLSKTLAENKELLLKILITEIVTYFDTKPEDLIILAYEQSIKNQINLVFTFTELIEQKATLIKLEKFSKLANENFGSIFSEYFYDVALTFKDQENLSSFSVANKKENTVTLSSPKVNKKISDFTIEAGKKFHFTIPKDTFFDKEDGYTPNLILELLKADNATVKKDFWLNLNKTSQTLKAFPFVSLINRQKNRSFDFVLRATNSRGLLAQFSFGIDVQQTSVSNAGVQIHIQGTEYFGTSITNVEILEMFSKRYMHYMKRDFQIIDFSNVKDVTNRFLLKIYFHAEKDGMCDQATIDYVFGKIFHSQEVSPAFSLAFQPELVITKVDFELQGYCKGYDDLKFQKNKSLTVQGQLPNFFVNNYRIFNFEIPQNLFHDNSGGDIRLELLSSTGEKLPRNSWIQLTDQNNIKIAYHNNEPSQNAFHVYHFILRATNQFNLFADIKFQVTATYSLADRIYRIVYSGRLRFEDDSTNVEIIEYFIKAFYNYLDRESTSKHTALMDFQRSSKRFSITFTDDRFANSCRKESFLSNALEDYTSRYKEIKPFLEKLLAPKISLDNAVIDTLKNCTIRSLKPSMIKHNSPSTKQNLSDKDRGVNTPPRLIILIPPIEVTFCKPFQYFVNADTFLDNDDGNTQHLHVQIEFQNTTKVPSSYWLQWDQRQLLIFGNIDLKDHSDKLEYFFLSAYDKQGLSTKTEIVFHYPKIQFNYNHIITMEILSSPDLNTNYINQEIKFMNKISSFVYQRNFIQIIKSEKSGEKDIYKFALCFPEFSPCPTIKQKKIIDEFTGVNNSPSPRLFSFMLPEVRVMYVKVEFIGACSHLSHISQVHVKDTSHFHEYNTMSRPTIQPHTSLYISSSTIQGTGFYPKLVNPLPLIELSQCDEFEFKIPSNTFYDKKNGDTRHLNVSIVLKNGGILPKNHWLQFDRKNQVMYGFISDLEIQKHQLSQFKLVATNSLSLSSEHIFTVKLPSLSVRPYSFVMMFFPQYFNLTTYQIFKLVSKKFKSFNAILKQIEFILMKQYPNNIYTIDWSGCNTFGDPCSSKKTLHLKEIFYIGEDVLRSDFITHMLPEIAVLKMNFNTKSFCTKHVHKVSKSTPIFLSSTVAASIKNNPPKVLTAIPQLSLAPCHQFSYQIPNDSFLDKEDGSTRQLKIYVLDNEMNKLSKESWIVFDEIKQQFKGVITVDHLLVKREYLYHIIAEDIGGLTARQVLTITIDMDMFNSPKHIFTTKGVISEKIDPGNLNMFIYERFYQYFVNQASLKGTFKGILIHSTHVSGPLLNNLETRWSVCGITCNQHNFTKIREKIFTPWNSLRVEFAMLMNPRVIITETNVHEKFDDCPKTTLEPFTSVYTTVTSTVNTPPIIFMPIPTLHLKWCQTLFYKIPANTCHDKEEGFTPNLQLTLLHRNFSEISEDSWIKLDKQNQVLHGSLRKMEMGTEQKDIFSYILICEDTAGLSVFQNLVFNFANDTETPNYLIQVKSYLYFSENATANDIKLMWVEKLKIFSNDDSDMNVQITDLQLSSVLYPQVTIAWFNCSVDDICSVQSQPLIDRFFNRRRSINDRFIQSMVPEFLLISGKIITKKECYTPTISTELVSTTRSLPTNNPPVALKKRIDISVNPCHRIIYHIPSNVFFDYEDGYTPNLSVELSRDQKLNSYYIRFNTTSQTFTGIAVLDEFIEDELEYLITAYDSMGLTAESLLAISLSNSYDTFSIKVITFAAVNFAHERELNQLNQLKTLEIFDQKLNSFFNDATLNLLYYSVNLDGKKFKVTWSFCNIIQDCNFNLVQRIKNALLDKTNTIRVEFIAALSPEFVITDIKIVYNESCKLHPTTEQPQTENTRTTPYKNTPPFSYEKEIETKVPLCGLLVYHIPDNLFLDREDGNTRNLRLLFTNALNNELDKYSWINFSNLTNTISGRITVELLSEKEKVHHYLLTAIDSGNLQHSIIFSATLPAKPEINFHVNMTMFSFSHKPEINNKQSFELILSKIGTFANDKNLDNIVVITYQESSQLIKIVWTNCSLIKTPCPTQKNLALKSKFEDRSKLQLVFSPNYRILSVSVYLSRHCFSTPILPSYTIPATSMIPLKTSRITFMTSAPSNLPPQVIKLISPIKIQLCESFVYHVSDNIFLDEDGMTSSLHLELLDINGEKLQENSWIQFNSQIQVAFGVLKVADIIQQSTNGFTFLLKATDSEGASTTTKMIFEKISSENDIPFYYEMTIECTRRGNYPLLNDLLQLIKKLSDVFGDQQVNNVKVIDFRQIPEDPFVFLLTWTNCSATSILECPSELLNYMNSIFFEKDETSILVRNNFLPQYKISYTKLIRGKKCQHLVTTTPSSISPIEQKPIANKKLQINVDEPCTNFHLNVPWDTFMDYQDGDTRKLLLFLSFRNNTMVPPNYWIHLDNNEQVISGAVLSESKGKNESFLFYLIASDKDGNIAKTDVAVHAITSNKEPMQKFTLMLNLNFNLKFSESKLKDIIVNRIIRYFGDQSNIYISVHNFYRERNSLTVVWSNCTNQGPPCDMKFNQLLKSNMVMENGKCFPSFANSFLPEFTFNDLKIDLHWQCRSNDVLTTISPSPSSTSFTYSSINTISKFYALKNITLTLSSCGDVFYEIPTGIFHNTGDKTTNNFKYRLLYDDYLPVTCDSWLQLNATSKILYGTAIEITKVLPQKFLLEAKNKVNSVAYAHITVENERIIKQSTFEFAISFYTTLVSLCDAELLHLLKNKMQKYFQRGTRNDLSVAYFTRGNLNSRSYVLFKNCSLGESICNYKEINYIRGRILEEGTYNVTDGLIQSLQPEFSSVSVLDEKKGECSKVTVLAVGEKPANICAYLCSEFKYRLPERLFVDANNRPARNLFLEITSLEGEKLSPNSWIEYDGNGSLIGVVTEKVYQNVPRQGYRYLLTAYDASGAQTQTALTIKMCGKKPSYKTSVTLQFQCPKTSQSGIKKVTKILKNYTYKYSKNSPNSIFVIDYEFKNSSLNLTWTNCSTGTIKINKEEVEYLKSLSLCRLIESTTNDLEIPPPIVKYDSLRYNVDFCKENKFKVPNDTFLDSEGKSISNISLGYFNGSTSNAENWIEFDREQLVILVLPSMDMEINTIYEFLLIATNIAGEKSNLTVFIEMFSMFPDIALRGRTLISTFEETKLLHVERFFEKMRQFIERDNQKFAIKTFHPYRNNTFYLEFGFCMTSYEPCPYNNITEIENALLENKMVKSEFFTFVFPQFVIEWFLLKRIGSCSLHRNQKPEIVQAITQINVSPCSFKEYEIPNKTFYDEEDGWTRNLTLSVNKANSCWFNFNVTLQLLTILVTEEALEEQPDSGYNIILTARDSRNASVDLTFTIKLLNFQISSYRIAVLFGIKASKFTNCVLESTFLLSKLQQFYQNASLSLRNIARSKNGQFIETTFTNCSMRYAPCDYITLNHMISTLETENNIIHEDFLEFFLPHFSVRHISESKDKVCLDINNKPPRVTGSVSLPKINPQSCIQYVLDRNLVNDFEDGNILNLNTFLVNSTTSKPIKADSWIFLNNSEKVLYIAATEKIALTRKYFFTFVFRDSKGSSDTLNFELEFANSLKREATDTDFLVHQTVSSQNHSSNIARFVCNIKETMEEKFNITITLLDFYKEKNNQLKLVWTAIETDCKQAQKIVNLLEKGVYKETFGIFIIEKLGACFFKSQLTATPNNTAFANPCEQFYYKIPQDIFRDSYFGNARNLTIYVTQMYPAEPLESIRYEEATQSFTGVLLAKVFSLYNYVEYNITATNPWSQSVYSTLTIVLDKIYKSEFEFIMTAAFYNEEGYFKFCTTFFQMLSSFLGENVILFNVTSETNSIYKVSFSTCKIAIDECPYLYVNEATTKLIETEGRPTYDFFSSLENIVPKSINRTNTTSCIDLPVRIGVTIQNITVSPCQPENSYQIPPDAFRDNEDGNVENLTLKFENSNTFPWIQFNEKTKTFTFFFTSTEISKAPKFGYELKVKARDNAGHYASQSFRVLFKEKLQNVNHILNFNMSVNDPQLKSIYEILARLKGRFSQYFEFETFRNLFFYNINPLKNNNRYEFSVLNCKVIDSVYCLPEENKAFFELFHTGNEINERMSGFFLPEFYIESSNEMYMNNCVNVSKDIPLITDSIPPIRLSFYNKTTYKLPDDLFYDFSDGPLNRNALSLRVRRSMPSNVSSFIQFMKESNEIVAFITQEQSKHFNKENNNTFLISVQDSSRNQIIVPLNIQFPQPLKGNLIMTTTIEKESNETILGLEDLYSFVERLDNYFSNVYRVSIFSQTKTKESTFKIDWSIDNFTAPYCNESMFNRFINLFIERKGVYNPSYVESLHRNDGFKHVETIFKTYGECRFENLTAQPIENVTINISRCGIIKHEAKFEENYTIYLFESPINEQYWLQYSNEEGAFVGIADENLQEANLQLYLQKGDQINYKKPILLNFVRNFEEVYSDVQVKTTVQCKYQNISTKLLIRQLNAHLIAINLNISNFHAKSFVMNSTNAVIYWNPCTVIALDKPVMQDVSNCSIRSENLMKKNEIPLIVNKLQNVILDCGEPINITLPTNTFFDYEDGSSLSMELLNSKYLPVSGKFIYFDNAAKAIIYSMPIWDCVQSNIEPYYIIKATDTDGQFVSETFTVTLNKQPVSCCLNLYIETTSIIARRTPALFAYDLLTFLNHNVYERPLLILVKIQELEQGITRVVLTSKNITNSTCYGEYVSELIKPMLDESNGKLTEEFSKYTKLFNITSVKKSYSEDCNATSTSAIAARDTSEPPTSAASTSSMEWFLYLLPLFVLAFVIFAACLFYYLCRFCYRKRDKNFRHKSLEYEVDVDGKDNYAVESDENSEKTAEKSALSLTDNYNTIPKETKDSKNNLAPTSRNSWDITTANVHNGVSTSNQKPYTQFDIAKASTSRPSAESIDKELMYKVKAKSAKVPFHSSGATHKRRSKGGLNLPALPSGPPPPYSPPRRHQIFKQNALPHYYERYSQPQRLLTPVIVPVKQTIIKNPGRTTILNKRRKLPALRMSRRYRRRKYEEPTEISDVSSVTDTSELSSMSVGSRSESPIEVRALLRGREKSLRRIFKRPRTLKLNGNTALKITSENINLKPTSSIEKSYRNKRAPVYVEEKNNEEIFDMRKYPTYRNEEQSTSRIHIHKDSTLERKRKLKDKFKKSRYSFKNQASLSNDRFSWTSPFLKKRKRKGKNIKNIDALLDAIPEEVFEQSYSPTYNGRKSSKKAKRFYPNTTLEEVEDVFSDDSSNC